MVPRDSTIPDASSIRAMRKVSPMWAYPRGMKALLPGILLAVVAPGVCLGQTRAGGEFQVNTYTTNSQVFPAVASDENGDFVAVWASDGQDGSGFGIFGQRFRASGLRQGGEFRVNTHTVSAQNYPAVASDPKGNFVVVWASRAQDDGVEYGIFGQRYDAQGTPQGTEFRVNTTVTGDQNLPSVSSDASGNFVVVWASVQLPGAGTDIFARRYDAAGTPQGSEFLVNSYTTGGQYRPAVASGPGGNFLVVWSHDPLQNDAQVRGQRFSATGLPEGTEFQVSSSTALQLYPAVAVA